MIWVGPRGDFAAISYYSPETERHSDVTIKHKQEVSYALTGRHCAAYVSQSDAAVCAVSLKQADTSHLDCAPSLESGLSLSSAQRHGALSQLNCAPFLIQLFLGTS